MDTITAIVVGYPIVAVILVAAIAWVLMTGRDK